MSATAAPAEPHELGIPTAVKLPTAAKALGIGLSTLYRLIADGEVRAVKIGGSTRIATSELARICAHGTAAPDDAPAA